MAEEDNTPSFGISIHSPADTGRAQEMPITPQYRDLRNQVLWWNPDTGYPEWRLLTDVGSEGMFGNPVPLLMGDNNPLLAGDGLPILFRPGPVIV